MRADLLKKELNLYTFRDLLEHYPYRHVDKTKINFINEVNFQTEYIQVIGKLISKETIGAGRVKRLVCELRDNTGSIDLIWFQGINWIQKSLNVGHNYLVYGKVTYFQGQAQLTHPEIEVLTEEKSEGKNFLEPVYPSTEKLKVKGLGGRQIGKLTKVLLQIVKEKDVPENLPDAVLRQVKLIPRFQAFNQIHFPSNPEQFQKALNRLKFEELFIAQVRMALLKVQRHRHSIGVSFTHVGELFNRFYNEYLPFELTGAQKRVIKEIRKDCGSGKQMNRLLQGDVGSGKTIVALLVMLIAADNGFQSCLMAPTEILAQQHFANLQNLLKDLPVTIAITDGINEGAVKEKRS